MSDRKLATKIFEELNNRGIGLDNFSLSIINNVIQIELDKVIKRYKELTDEAWPPDDNSISVYNKGLAIAYEECARILRQFKDEGEI